MRALRLQHRAFCSGASPAGRPIAPAPHHAVQHRVVRAHAAPPSATYYSEELVACEGRGDAVRMTELLTEVRVLKVQGIPPCTMEAGVRTLAAGGEWQRAVDLLESIRQQSPGHAPSAATLECVVSALAAGQQAHRALAMLDGLLEAQPAAAPGSDGAAAVSSLSPAYNAVARALARQESSLRDAHKLLESMTAREDISVEPQTFNTLALAFLKAGDGDTAEEILEMRDYL